MKVTIIGNGYVGKATKLLLRRSGVEEPTSNDFLSDVLIYDNVPDKSECSLKEALNGDLFFVCVPTPMRRNGSCDLSVVENVIRTLIGNGIPSTNIILRSTVPVGTCDRLKVNFMPEFLTEANWREDVKNTQDWIIGVLDPVCELKIVLPKILEGDLHFHPNKEVELVKYVRNCFLATKVSFFNEINNFCEEKNIKYQHVKELVTLDPRINESHTCVPGTDGKKGFGGTCFPKDMHSLFFQMQNALVVPHLIKAAIDRNEIVDRPEKEWTKDKGRAVSD